MNDGQTEPDSVDTDVLLVGRRQKTDAGLSHESSTTS